MRWLVWLLALLLVGLAVWLPTRVHQPELELTDTTAQVSWEVPQVPLVTDVPDFSIYTDVREKKEAFFRFLAPLVQVENSIIELERRYVLFIQDKIQKGESLTPKQRKQFQTIAQRYQVDLDRNNMAGTFTVLLRRIDVVPVTLVLVQAANESGWGTSRFAREGLNFFGQWCFSKGCGLVPDARVEGMTHEVRKFASVNASVRSYLRNINTHPAYFELRRLREAQRASNKELRALDLTPGLLSYSERGEDYMNELNLMIRVNRPIIVDMLQPPNSDSAPE
ncbi:Bax protein [Pseudidiomarina indica]|uniref:Bax protein n=1 Tax=Pseudidiomarina indica TaxID=1159017 RepID=A0A1G6A827_9GAMM|nr:glucosaminidase domain-containing protein [Pseudidiomarina indica]SDB04588.1 Bax protein [Pseudidiomarina indica]